MPVRYQEKIITLWAVFLLGTLFHTQLGLMPLFHGQDVAISHAQGTRDIAWIFWLMLVFFAIPMIAMIATLFTASKPYRKLHFGMTCIFSLLNFFHVVADLRVQPIVWYQIVLMVLLFLIGLLLNGVSWQWMQERTQSKLWERANS
ncbi:MAG: hypothetical protein HY785_28995 [Oscillatoriophycideae cyanobacterium NC_groundwater_1537_Pr4_S-0.65um_50_18]|nr:hypothetical protein [Oscillatoriophycideae cyanobacterium NC_groundwater_1537_Pr4_S-0.65um_50_18]